MTVNGPVVQGSAEHYAAVRAEIETKRAELALEAGTDLGKPQIGERDSEGDDAQVETDRNLTKPEVGGRGRDLLEAAGLLGNVGICSAGLETRSSLVNASFSERGAGPVAAGGVLGTAQVSRPEHLEIRLQVARFLQGDGAGLSNREVARRTGTSHPLVAKVRRELAVLKRWGLDVASGSITRFRDVQSLALAQLKAQLL